MRHKPELRAGIMRGGDDGARAAATLIALGALLAFAAVAAGAFGAHGLRDRLPAPALGVYHTAAHYHLLHAVATVLAGITGRLWPSSRAPVVAGVAFVAGVLLFSGSLYLVVLAGARWLGAVTPLGGLALMAGWLALAWGGWRGRG